MPITFTRAPVVEVGDVPTSKQMAAQAAAVNDRILSGIGDWAWRLSYYLVNLFRQVRNPDSSGYVFPPQLEFWDIYGAIDPDKSTYVWPTEEAGEYEGANLASTGMAMVKGNPSVYQESERYGDVPLYYGGSQPTTQEGYWELAKAQRGGVDLDVGVYAWPVGDAAQAFMRIVSAYWSPHGKSYGGYLPTPDVAATAAGTSGECGDDESNGKYVLNWQRKFTGLRSDVDIPTHHGTLTYDGDGNPIITYDGSCPCWTTYHDAGHVVGIIRAGISYKVVVSNAASDCDDISVDTFPVADWIEGPYDNYGELRHTDGDHLNRVVNAMLTDFRGTPEQRENDSFRIESISFDNQAFFTSQYALSPARGWYNSSDNAIDVDYPQCRFAGGQQLASGTVAAWTSGGSSYSISDGYVLAGYFIKASKLETKTGIRFSDSNGSFAAATLEPDEDGNATALAYFSTAEARQEIQCELTNQVRFSDSTGQIRIEIAELEERKPDHWDAAAILRLSAAGNGRFVDGRGMDTSTAYDIGRNFMRYGCILGEYPDDPYPEVNRNPFYDVARRLVNKCLHIIPRRQFVAYEVADGKSILYLKRYAYGLKNDRVDLLAGIAPSPEPLADGELVKGETYVVHGAGTVSYAGGSYGDGATFTATSVKAFTASGSAQVYVYDGVRSEALEKGWSNRWCGFVEPKHYNPSETSIYKPSAYSDYWAFSDRCHFRSNNIPSSALVRFFSYNYQVTVDSLTGQVSGGSNGNPRAQAALYAPEAPTGYRYIEGANDDRYMTDGDRFRKSCRVYEPPLEIESAVVHDWDADIIKVTFSGRFQTHEDAPATWSATAPTWDLGGTKPTAVTDLETEISGVNGYRTIDNALRAYHVHLWNGHWQCPMAALGDYGGYSSPSDVYGACYPTLHLIALQNAPYDDGNDTVQSHDTRMTVDEHQKLDLYLRAGCEGWLDEALSLEHVCANNPVGFSDVGSLFDYSWENLQYEANGTRWTGLIGSSVRGDDPEGFGPLPSTKIYADQFNNHSRCLNLLTKARIPVPTSLQYEYDQYVSNSPRTFTNGMLDGISYETPTYSATYGPFAGVGQPRTSLTTQYGPDGVDFYENIQTYSISVSTSWQHCIPPALLAHIQANYGGFVARKVVTTQTERKGQKRAPGSEEYCDNSSGFASVWTDDGGTSFWCWNKIETEVTTCESVPCGVPIRAPVCPRLDGRVASGPRVNAAATEITYTPLLTDQFWVEVPLTDYTGT